LIFDALARLFDVDEGEHVNEVRMKSQARARSTENLIAHLGSDGL